MCTYKRISKATDTKQEEEERKEGGGEKKEKWEGRWKEERKEREKE